MYALIEMGRCLSREGGGGWRQGDLGVFGSEMVLTFCFCFFFGHRRYPF